MRRLRRIFFFLLLVTSFSFAQANGGAAWDPNMMMGIAAMQNPANFAHLPFRDSVALGMQLGAVGCILDATKGVLSRTLGSTVDHGQGALRSWYKSLMVQIHGAQGFEVRELFSYKWVLERSINTHISNVAKGARVVRAHALEQEKKDVTAVKKPYGISALKKISNILFRNCKSVLNITILIMHRKENVPFGTVP